MTFLLQRGATPRPSLEPWRACEFPVSAHGSTTPLGDRLRLVGRASDRRRSVWRTGVGNPASRRCTPRPARSETAGGRSGARHPVRRRCRTARAADQPGRAVRRRGHFAEPCSTGRWTAARERRVDDQVEPVIADVHDLQFGDGEFDLVVSFTGLHCFPDPHQAILELGRVTKSGGAVTGSTILQDISWRSKPIQAIGTAANVLGPGLTLPS